MLFVIILREALTAAVEQVSLEMESIVWISMNVYQIYIVVMRELSATTLLEAITAYANWMATLLL